MVGVNRNGLGVWPGKPQYVAMMAGNLAQRKRFGNTLTGFDWPKLGNADLAVFTMLVGTTPGGGKWKQVELSGIKWNQVELGAIADCGFQPGAASSPEGLRIVDLMGLVDDLDGLDDVDGEGGWDWIASRHEMA